jgi:hypothetical protein
MSEQKNPPDDDYGRVLPFTPRHAAKPGRRPFASWAKRPSRSPVDDIAKYERPVVDADDYRHRMAVNAAAFGFCVLLVAIGIWLAIKIAELRRDQDCILSGRRNCAQLSITGNPPR